MAEGKNLMGNFMSDYVDTPDRLNVPAGEYKARIVGVSAKVSGGNPENVGLNPQLEIIEGDFKGARIFDNLCFIKRDAKDKQGQERSAWQRASDYTKAKCLCIAAGFEPDYAQYKGQVLDAQFMARIGMDYLKPNLMNREVMIVVSLRDGDNQIRDYKMITAAATPPVAVAAAPVAAAPVAAGPPAAAQ